MIWLIASISAGAALGSFIFDVIVFRWHVADRRRIECAEQREAKLERRVCRDEKRISLVRADVKARRPAR